MVLPWSREEELLTFFLILEWWVGGLKGCEKRRMMIMIVRVERGSWHIIRGQGGWRCEDVITSWKSKLLKGSQINSHLREWRQNYQVRMLVAIQVGGLDECGDYMQMGKNQEKVPWPSWCKKRGVERKRELGVLVVKPMSKRITIYPFVKTKEPRSWEEGCPTKVEWKGDYFWGVLEKFGGINSWEVGL
jgi:hypothetical protein